MTQAYKTDVALMSVTKTEYSALAHFHDWKDLVRQNDNQIYQISTFQRDGKTRSIVHARQDEMGMTASAALATKLIYEFRPRYLIMVGIAAGVALDNIAEQMYGDVVVPDVVWNYACGKFVSPGKAEITFGDLGFLPRSTYAPIPEGILPYLAEAQRSPENPCHIHIGPMACGSTVVANRKVIEKHIHTIYRETVGLDMESYAVVYSALHATEPRPIPLIVKSVCDFADDGKSDDYQRFAAYTSCDFAKFLYEKILPMDDELSLSDS